MIDSWLMLYSVFYVVGCSEVRLVEIEEELCQEIEDKKQQAEVGNKRNWLFRPREPPTRAASEVAYLSHHAIIVIVVVISVMDRVV